MEFQQERFFKPHVTDEPTIAQSSDEHEGNEVEEIEKEQDEASTKTIAPLDALSPHHSKRRTDTLFALIEGGSRSAKNNNYSIVRIHQCFIGRITYMTGL